MFNYIKSDVSEGGFPYNYIYCIFIFIAKMRGYHYH